MWGLTGRPQMCTIVYYVAACETPAVVANAGRRASEQVLQRKWMSANRTYDDEVRRAVQEIDKLLNVDPLGLPGAIQ